MEPDSKKKILFDLTFLFDQYSKRGIGVYGKNVIVRLFKSIVDEESEYEIHVIGFNNLTQNLIELGFSQFSIEELLPKISFYSLGEERNSDMKNVREWKNSYLPIIEKVHPDIFYAVHFERGLPSVPKFAKKLSFKPKTIVIAHDAIPLVTSKFSSKGFLANFIKSRFYKSLWQGVRHADLVITASEFSKNDLIKYGKVEESKIKVIYLGVDEKFDKKNYIIEKNLEENTIEAYNLIDKHYFFYDTGIESNKGAVYLLQIFKEILNLNSLKLPNFLVITGKDFYKGEGLSIKPRTILGDDFLKLAKKYKVAQNLITTDKVSDEHLVTLLFNAKVYLNLSTYEGFGLGIAQAMKAEIPIIGSKSSCIPEIVQDGGYLIDLNSNMDFAKTAEEILEYFKDEDKVNETIKNGKKISKKYDWDKTVEKTLELIKKI